MFKQRQPVDLIRTLVYLRKTGITPGAFDAVFMQVTLITHQFHRLIADLKGRIGSEYLGRSRSRLIAAELFTAVPDHRARRPEADRHIRIQLKHPDTR